MVQFIETLLRLTKTAVCDPKGRTLQIMSRYSEGTLKSRKIKDFEVKALCQRQMTASVGCCLWCHNASLASWHHR